MSELSDKHPIEGLMSSAMQGLKEMIDVNTIVGSPITTSDGTVIMPISKVESEALSFLKTKNCSAVNRKRSITCSAAEQAADCL